MAKNAIPQPSNSIVPSIKRVLEPMRDVLQRAFFGRTNERAVTRGDLIKLGLVTQLQVDATLED